MLWDAFLCSQIGLMSNVNGGPPLKSESLPDVRRCVRRPSAGGPGYAAPSSGGSLTSHRTRPSRPGGLCPARADAAAFQFGVQAPDHSQTTQV